jgi:hypothetical protein
VNVKVRCLRCGKAWSHASGATRLPCPGCGEVEWDSEPMLERYVGLTTEYQVAEENVDVHRILTLGLAWVFNPQRRARVPLSYRLRTDFRRMKEELGVSDGRDRGQWTIHAKRRPLGLPPNPFLPARP